MEFIMQTIKLYVFGILTILFLLLTSCSLPINENEKGQNINVIPDESEKTMESPSSDDSEDENTTELTEAGANEIEKTPMNNLTQSEIESLIFMREEEKLAHDVYLALYEIWELPIFQNIAESEQTHTDAVARLLEIYSIPDPADTSPLGVFVNPELQKLYDELTELGDNSLADALKVGAAIEEIDILDLQEALEFIEDNAIRQVYQNLLRGSENHLRAFTSTLERQTGEVYTPQYLDQEAYDEILSEGPRQKQWGAGQRP